jgi:hypothetical protein
MATSERNETTAKRNASQDPPKPGSSATEARKVGGEGDFGAPAGGERTAERDYVSRNTKMSDPGAAQPFDFEDNGVRDHGAGGRNSGPGSASGGDVDPDITGVGTGGTGVAYSGNIGRPAAPDDSDGSSDEFASGGHAHGHKPRATLVRGSTVSPNTDVTTGADAQGADAATNPSALDADGVAGESCTGEAQGEDNALPPSSDDQG